MSLLQSREKYLEYSKQIKHDYIAVGNFEVCFYVVFDHC